MRAVGALERQRGQLVVDLKDLFYASQTEQRLQQLLARSGFNPQNPAKLKMFTTNGHFSGDFDVAVPDLTLYEGGRR